MTEDIVALHCERYADASAVPFPHSVAFYPKDSVSLAAPLVLASEIAWKKDLSMFLRRP